MGSKSKVTANVRGMSAKVDYSGNSGNSWV